MANHDELLAAVTEVLKNNDQGGYTIPASGLYPHQWLWDSCFIAIGLRHVNIRRAERELRSLLRGQWSNGMLPHMTFANDHGFRRDRALWRSHLSPFAPDDISTSGITQPPILAEAVVRVGEKMTKPERRTWYQTMYPALLRYHQWLYNERDPSDEGLVFQVHPWETGLDNSPPLMHELQKAKPPLWIVIAKKLHILSAFNFFRRDLKFIPAAERLNTLDALSLYAYQRRLRQQHYDVHKILKRHYFAVDDLLFNCIFIRANAQLASIAMFIGQELPEDFQARVKKSKQSLDLLWDGYAGQYYSRNVYTKKHMREPSIATLMPLYSGAITEERAEQLVKLLHNKHIFGANYPVPSVPFNSKYFREHNYWQGPTWINTNWLLIDGLERYGYQAEADIIRLKSLELVATHGSHEYFSPINGSPAGATNFSWTAALTIDLLQKAK